MMASANSGAGLEVDIPVLAAPILEAIGVSFSGEALRRDETVEPADSSSDVSYPVPDEVCGVSHDDARPS